MRIYIDTSVVGGIFDDIFSADTKSLFDRVVKKEVVLIVSELLEAELLRAPSNVKDYFKSLPKTQIEKVELTREARKLADIYIDEKVVSISSLVDYQHIAIATLAHVDVLARAC